MRGRVRAHTVLLQRISRVAHKTNAVCPQFSGHNISIYGEGALISAVFSKNFAGIFKQEYSYVVEKFIQGWEKKPRKGFSKYIIGSFPIVPGRRFTLSICSTTTPNGLYVDPAILVSPNILPNPSAVYPHSSSCGNLCQSVAKPNQLPVYKYNTLPDAWLFERPSCPCFSLVTHALALSNVCIPCPLSITSLVLKCITPKRQSDIYLSSNFCQTLEPSILTAAVVSARPLPIELSIPSTE